MSRRDWWRERFDAQLDNVIGIALVAVAVSGAGWLGPKLLSWEVPIQWRYALAAVFFSFLFIVVAAGAMSVIRRKRQNAAKALAEATKENVQLKDEREMRLAIDGLYSLSDAAEELERVSSERDDAQRALKDVTWNCALEKLQWMAERAILRGYTPSVVIRFAPTYDDYPLVQTIESVFKEHTPKWPITIDASNNPLLRPDNSFKVIFVVNDLGPFVPIANIFDKGGLLPAGTHVGLRRTADTNTETRILIEVLPTVKGGS